MDDPYEIYAKDLFRKDSEDKLEFQASPSKQ